MDFFGAAYGSAWAKKTPLLKNPYIFYSDENWHSYNLTKEYPKYIQITREMPLEF